VVTGLQLINLQQ